MEDRLYPINTLIGLTRPHDVNPGLLHEAGFLLSGLEVPVTGSGGKVVADAVLFHPGGRRVVLCEVKSGSNIEDAQAIAYSVLRAESVVQATNIDVPTRGPISKELLYVCKEENVERILLGLTSADVSASVLAVGSRPHTICLYNAEQAGQLLRAALPDQLTSLPAPPTNLIPFDHETPIEFLEPIVRAELIAALSRMRPHISLTALSERVAPFLPVYGQAERNRLHKRVGVAARTIATREPLYFQFRGRTNNADGTVTLLKSPEDLDPRGRTQAYQALSRSRRHRPRPGDPNQIDLLAELLNTDDGVGDTAEGPEGAQ